MCNLSVWKWAQLAQSYSQHTAPTCYSEGSPIFSAILNNCAVRFSIIHPTNPTGSTKFNHASQCVWYSFWTTAFLHGCSMIVLCMFPNCRRIAQNFSYVCNLPSEFTQCFVWQPYSAHEWCEVCLTTGRWLVHCLLSSMEASQCVITELNWQEVISNNCQIKLISLSKKIKKYRSQNQGN